VGAHNIYNPQGKHISYYFARDVSGECCARDVVMLCVENKP